MNQISGKSALRMSSPAPEQPSSNPPPRHSSKHSRA
jgi:hypothetical protein